MSTPTEAAKTERERFEEWHRTLMVPMYPHGYARSKIDADMYEDRDLNVRWHAWQASTAFHRQQVADCPSVWKLSQEWLDKSSDHQTDELLIAFVRTALTDHFTGKIAEARSEYQKELETKCGAHDAQLTVLRAELAESNRQLERLKPSREWIESQFETETAKKLKECEAQVERMRGVLDRYAKHDAGCGCTLSFGRQCDCGLKQAITNPPEVRQGE